jgi:hypothetical protein
VKVLVYVEGPSDRDALTKLLRPVIDAGRANGVGVNFLPQGSKDALLDEVPRKAADYLAEKPDDWVFVLPDLYPMARYRGTKNQHESFAEFEKLVRARFDSRAAKVNVSQAAQARFRVHCLKHDLEALLLAAPDQLRQRLKTSDALKNAWRLPVEDQNDERPPKRVVEALFDKYRKKPRYVDTQDAPWILERADLKAVEAACQQSFAPFVRDLRTACGLSG